MFDIRRNKYVCLRNRTTLRTGFRQTGALASAIQSPCSSRWPTIAGLGRTRSLEQLFVLKRERRSRDIRNDGCGMTERVGRRIIELKCDRIRRDGSIL